jgi:leader peptidase (prepilin peptidase)/N-methyltransferase
MSPTQFDTLAMALVLGAVAAYLGSFTTVVAHREGTGSSLGGRSRCPKCSHELSVRDLIPIVSWVLLRAKCRHCHLPIPLRYPATEATFVAIAVGVVIQHGASLATCALVLTCLGVAMAARIDLVTQTLPNPILAITGILSISMFSLAAFASANWSDLIRGLTAAAIAFVVALIVYGLTRGGLGEGDVKFAPLIWLPLGWLGWGAAFAGYLVAAGVALIFAITIAVRQRRWRGVRLPLGPALAAGVILVVIGDLHWPAELSQ